jgi:hypothetical protein
MNTTNDLPEITQEQGGYRPHCTFCGGRGRIGEKAEIVRNEFEHRYRIPLSHALCKESVLSLNLAFHLPNEEATLA